MSCAPSLSPVLARWRGVRGSEIDKGSKITASLLRCAGDTPLKVDLAREIHAAKGSKKLQLCGKFFDRFDDGSGTLTYGQIFAIAKTTRMDLLDALGLMIQIASDTDGALTKAEFLLFMQSLEPLEAEPKHDAALQATSGAGSLPEPRQIWRKVKSSVKMEVRELMDSVSMVGQDLSYSAALLRSPCPEAGRFSEMERAWLLRACKDVVLFLPIAAIIVAPLTPAASSDLS